MEEPKSATMRWLSATVIAVILFSSPVSAKVDLVTLPEREQVEITIYNSADLTLVRDQRALTLSRGDNRLQFSWANTLIDPTSLELLAPLNGDRVTVQDLVFPARTRDLGVWNVWAEQAGPTPVEINYFTSGIQWQAYYLATLNADDSEMKLEGFVRVDNHSGEDYENAATRLLVGKINLLDRIAELARREWPYGRPTQPVPAPMAADDIKSKGRFQQLMYEARAEIASVAPKEIRKEGLSEYFLYTIEGTENVPDGWGKRLVSFQADAVPVRNLYRFEEERYGLEVNRFLSFANDTEHGLGTEPIPGGMVKVFRRHADSGGLSYVGTQQTAYIPKGEQVRLDLGPSRDVTVKPTLMETHSDNFEWKETQPSRSSRITGWDEHQTVRLEVANYRDTPVRVELRRNFPVSSWQMNTEGVAGNFEKVDLDTVEFILDLAANEKKEFSYNVTLHYGTRGL